MEVYMPKLEKRQDINPEIPQSDGIGAVCSSQPVFADPPAF